MEVNSLELVLRAACVGERKRKEKQLVVSLVLVDRSGCKCICHTKCVAGGRRVYRRWLERERQRRNTSGNFIRHHSCTPKSVRQEERERRVREREKEKEEEEEERKKKSQ